MFPVFGRTIDKALRASEQRFDASIKASIKASEQRFDASIKASEQRHQAFVRELARESKERERRRERFEREMEQRYRDEVQITREFMRRNELVTNRLVERIEGLAEDSKAHTKALLRVLDRLQNGGGTATAE
jgi:hypothetical protein